MTGPTFSIALDLSTCGVIAQGIADHLAQRGEINFSRLEDLDPIRSRSPWLTSDEAAEHLRIGKTELQRLAAAGTIPSEQDAPGGRRFFHRDELDDWRRAGGKRR